MKTLEHSLPCWPLCHNDTSSSCFGEILQFPQLAFRSTCTNYDISNPGENHRAASSRRKLGVRPFRIETNNNMESKKRFFRSGYTGPNIWLPEIHLSKHNTTQSSAPEESITIHQAHFERVLLCPDLGRAMWGMGVVCGDVRKSHVT